MNTTTLEAAQIALSAAREQARTALAAMAAIDPSWSRSDATSEQAAAYKAAMDAKQDADRAVAVAHEALTDLRDRPAVATLADLEAAHHTAHASRILAELRVAKIDEVLAAMTVIDLALTDVRLTEGDRAIVDLADNARAFARLTEARVRAVAEVDRLTDEQEAAWQALNAAPDERAA